MVVKVADGLPLNSRIQARQPESAVGKLAIYVQVPDNARAWFLYYLEDVGGRRRGIYPTLVILEIAIGERLCISAKERKGDRVVVEIQSGSLVDFINLKDGDGAEITGRRR